MEYVSREMRDHVVEFVTQGGNAAFFAGQTSAGGRVRIEDDGQALVCCKLADLDPTDDPGALTVNWPDALAGGDDRRRL